MEPKGYTTEEILENYILNDIDATFSDQIDSWIAGIEKFIDGYTGRNFIADESATARKYDGDDTNELLIDDAVEITKVEVGNDGYGGSFDELSAGGADGYFLYPENYSVRGLPVRKIVLNSRRWPAGAQNNQITAKWGFSATVPADIQFAATVFVAGVLNQHRQGGDEIKSEKIGNYTVTYNTDKGQNSFGDFSKAKEILDRYRKLNL